MSDQGGHASCLSRPLAPGPEVALHLTAVTRALCEASLVAWEMLLHLRL